MCCKWWVKFQAGWGPGGKLAGIFEKFSFKFAHKKLDRRSLFGCSPYDSNSAWGTEECSGQSVLGGRLVSIAGPQDVSISVRSRCVSLWKSAHCVFWAIFVSFLLLSMQYLLACEIAPPCPSQSHLLLLLLFIRLLISLEYFSLPCRWSGT